MSIFIIIVTVIILFYLLTSFKIYLVIYFIFLFFIYLLTRGPIRPEGSPFDRFFNPGILRVEGVS